MKIRRCLAACLLAALAGAAMGATPPPKKPKTVGDLPQQDVVVRTDTVVSGGSS